MCSGYISISCDLVADVTQDVQTSWIAANHYYMSTTMIVRIIQDILSHSGVLNGYYLPFYLRYVGSFACNCTLTRSKQRKRHEQAISSSLSLWLSQREDWIKQSAFTFRVTQSGKAIYQHAAWCVGPFKKVIQFFSHCSFLQSLWSLIL